MNLLLFIGAIIVSFVAIRIGAVAFHLTGLEWSLAKFQALSCFSGTGFTTKESELVVGHPQRRRIASVLMILGNAGFVTLIATFANSLRPNTYLAQFKLPFFGIFLPSWVAPWANLAIIVFSLFVIYRFFTYRKVIEKFTNFLRERLIRKEIVKPLSFEEIIIATGGYGVSSVEVLSDSPIVNKTLYEAALRNYDINILAIEREKRIIPNPPAETKIVLGDRLICFGKLDNIRQNLCPASK